MIEFDLEYVNHMPIFSVPLEQEDDELFRVWGFQRARTRVIFPAFAPLVYDTREDLRTVYAEGEVKWSPAALDHIASLEEDKRKIDAIELPEDLDFVYPPFEHQRLALVHALYNYRYYLALDMGLGKSKILIDTIRALKLMGEPHRTLLAVPPHLVQNWRRQIDEHGNGELTYQLLADEENNSLSADFRAAVYTGQSPFDFTKAGVYHEENPTLHYHALEEGLPDDVYAIEAAYVEAIVSGDSDARTKARAKLRRRARKYGFELPPGSWRVISESQIPKAASEVDIVIGSYDAMVEDFKNKVIQQAQFDVFAADEAHYFKSYNSTRSKVFRKIVRGMARCYLMSGSPSAGDPRHLYSALEILSPILTGGYMKFMRRYVVKSKFNENMVVGFKNLHIMNQILGSISLRMKQEDCVDLGLPALRVIDLPIEIDAATRETYNNIVSDWQTWLPGANELLEIQYGGERVTKLLQVLSGFVVNSGKTNELCTDCPFLLDCVKEDIKPYSKHCQVEQKAPKREIERFATAPKLKYTQGLLDDILQSDDNKVIIWCSFTEEVAMLAKLCVERKWGYSVVQGSTTNPQAQRDRFAQDPDCRVYISNVAISEGFTLNEANYVIYYGAPFNLTDYEQSIKRNYRIGQDRPVTVYRLIVEGTIHEAIYRALSTKRDISAAIGDVVRCDGCAQRARCQNDGTLPFDANCIYDKKVDKETIKPKRLQ